MLTELDVGFLGGVGDVVLVATLVGIDDGMERMLALDGDGAEPGHLVIVEVDEGVSVDLHGALVPLGDLDQNGNGCGGRIAIEGDFEEVLVMFVGVVLDVIEEALTDHGWQFPGEWAPCELGF